MRSAEQPGKWSVQQRLKFAKSPTRQAIDISDELYLIPHATPSFFIALLLPPRTSPGLPRLCSRRARRHDWRMLQCRQRSNLNLGHALSLIHISEPTRLLSISYAV